MPLRAATDSPPVQHSLQKQLRGSRRMKAEIAPQTTRDTPQGVKEASIMKLN